MHNELIEKRITQAIGKQLENLPDVDYQLDVAQLELPENMQTTEKYKFLAVAASALICLYLAILMPASKDTFDQQLNTLMQTSHRLELRLQEQENINSINYITALTELSAIDAELESLYNSSSNNEKLISTWKRRVEKLNFMLLLSENSEKAVLI